MNAQRQRIIFIRKERVRHTREGGYPNSIEKKWIPVSTGMTTKDRNAVFQQPVKTPLQFSPF
jgi:hypothetical protein